MAYEFRENMIKFIALCKDLESFLYFLCYTYANTGQKLALVIVG